MGSGDVAEFEAYRQRMFGLAYRMLGSAAEAEDTVQDAYLRWRQVPRSEIGHLGAWLAKVVTNLCLNRLDSARARREQYVGEWLPEPVLTRGGPLESAEQGDSVSLALLVLLERLTPPQRAAFVLREAFGYPHREVAKVLDVPEVSARQLYQRARQAVSGPVRRTTVAPREWRGLVDGFLAAAREGDVARLEKLLVTDAVSYADGGGKFAVARRPVRGRENVAFYLGRGVAKSAAGVEAYAAEVNRGPGLVATVGGRLLAVGALEVRDGLLAELRLVVNPDKLAFVRRQLSHSGVLPGSLL